MFASSALSLVLLNAAADSEWNRIGTQSKAFPLAADQHVEEQKFRALRMMDENGQIPPDGLWLALEHRRQMLAQSDRLAALHDLSANQHGSPSGTPKIASIQTNGWTWLGPGNIGGRVRSILIHPTLTNILWCGSVSGGVWKSTNSGASWLPLDDFMANLAVACMAMDPTNADIIYAGTGEGANPYAHALRGAGIFKTSNAGATWMRLSSTASSSFQYVNRLAIDPNNSQVILAAAYPGRAVVLANPSEYVRVNLDAALAALGLLALTADRAGNGQLVGKVAETDVETLNAVSRLREATAPMLAEHLQIKLTACNQRLKKLADAGAVLRTKFSAASGGDQYLYAWPL